MWIMGFLGIAMYIPVLMFLKDLSPELRMKIYQRPSSPRMEAEGGKPSRGRTSRPARARPSLRC